MVDLQKHSSPDFYIHKTYHKQYMDYITELKMLLYTNVWK
jgi:hypothetical protein